MKLIEEKENPLFSRKEITFQIDSNVSPSRADVLKFISEKFSTQPETVKIRGIRGKFGSNTFTVETSIYNSKEDMEKIERKKKKDEGLLAKPVEEEGAEKEELKNEEVPKAESAEEKNEEPKTEEAQEESKSEEIKE